MFGGAAIRTPDGHEKPCSYAQRSETGAFAMPDGLESIDAAA
jgi:hypothetical protein